MQTNSHPATLRAMAVAVTIVEVALVLAAAYHTLAGNAIALAIFWGLAFFCLFLAASLWGADFDNRTMKEEPQEPLSPHDIHDLVEVDYANLLRLAKARRLVITLRAEPPFAIVEAISGDYNHDWIVDGDSMFESYVKAWVKASNDERTTRD